MDNNNYTDYPRAPSASSFTSTRTLPSVLEPAARPLIVLTYEEAASAFRTMCRRFPTKSTSPDPKVVDVVIYDTKGGAPSCHKVTLHSEQDLKSMIVEVQNMVDQRQNEPAHQGKGRLLVRSIEVRAGEPIDSHCPSLDAEVHSTQIRGRAAVTLIWEHEDGALEFYWKYLRIMMQAGMTPVTPILKVRTINCSHEEAGHVFESPTVEFHRPRRYSGGEVPNGVRLNPDASAFRFGGDAIDEESVDDENEINTTATERQDGKGDDGDGEEVIDNVDKYTWGYYQRLGGDTKMHKMHKFDHLMFVPKPEVEHRDHVEGETYEYDFDAELAAKHVTGKQKQETSKEASAADRAKYDHCSKEFESARSFDSDDDETFFPAGCAKKNTIAEKGFKGAISALKAASSSQADNTPTIAQPKPNHVSYAAAYYQNQNQNQNRGTTTTASTSGTNSEAQAPPHRFGSPRNTVSKSTFAVNGKARAFTPSQAPFALNAATFALGSSRTSSPSLKYTSNTSSFHMPSTNNQFGGSNTFSRSRPASPLRFSQNTLYGMGSLSGMAAAATGNNTAYHNQLFVPPYRGGDNTSPVQGYGQHYADWQSGSGSASGSGEVAYQFDFGNGM